MADQHFESTKKATSTIKNELGSNASLRKGSLTDANLRKGSGRTLRLHFDNILWTKGTIYDSDNKTALYRMHFGCSNPIIKVESLYRGPESNSTSAMASDTAACHLFKRHVDLVVAGCGFKLSPKGFLKEGFTYTSPALGGTEMKWQSQSRLAYYNIVCLDDDGTPVARLNTKKCGLKNAGTIDLIDSRFLEDGPLRDEVVMTGLAVLQARLAIVQLTI